jgi:signal transduction histidine kinase
MAPYERRMLAQGPAWRRRAGDVLLIVLAALWDLPFYLLMSDPPGLSFELGGRTYYWSAGVALAVLSVPYLVLLLRWRFPWIVLGFTVVAYCVFALVFWVVPEPVAALLVALYPVARRAYTRGAAVALALCILVVVGCRVGSNVLFDILYGQVTYENGDPLSFFDSYLESTRAVLSFVLLLLLVWFLARLVVAAERRAERERREEAAAAVRAERLHMARELHDIVSHYVSGMTLQAAGAKTLVFGESSQVRSSLEAIESTGVEAMEELHRFLGLLRAAEPDDDSPDGFPTQSLAELDSLVASVRDSGLEVEVSVEGHPAELDRRVGLTAYRIVQEALTNTVKHAGRGASARIHLRWTPQALTLTIRDKAGFGYRSPSKLNSGHGLIGVAERVDLIGGSLEVGPVTGGYLVRAHLPIRPTTRHIPAGVRQDLP